MPRDGSERREMLYCPPPRGPALVTQGRGRRRASKAGPFFLMSVFPRFIQFRANVPSLQPDLEESAPGRGDHLVP